MCFRGNDTVDDPTKMPIRTVSVFSKKVNDPTQQPIHITESNEAHMSESQGPPPASPSLKKRLGSYKNQAAFVDVTNQEPKAVTRKSSNPEAVTPLRPDPKKTMDKTWRGRSTHPGTFGLGFGADFGATAMG